MKRVLRSFAVGLLAGGLIGLWCGMNIGKGRPLLSNPFAERSLGQQSERIARDAYEDAARAVEGAGDTARDAANDALDAVNDGSSR